MLTKDRTLRNHLKKIPQAESDKAFYKHIKILRDKRWIRGHQYVADAVELEVPYGETFEGIGKVWDKKEGRYKYGYKLERSYLSGCALIVYGRDKYYGIFSGVEYGNLIAKRTAKSATKEIAKELEKMLVEKISKKKITEFTKRLKQE